MRKSQPLYDTETIHGPICEAGTYINMFQVPFGQNGKTELDTNMTQSGVLSAAPEVMRVKTLYFLPPIKSTVDDRTHLCYNVLLEFWVNQNRVFASPIIFLDQMDSEKLLFSEYDKFTQALIKPDLQNLVVTKGKIDSPSGRRLFGWYYMFEELIEIGVQTPFRITLKIINQLELSQSLKISVLLEGEIWRAVG